MSVLAAVGYLAGLQIFSRGVTFLSNVALTRYMQDTEALGVSSVQLYLLYTLSLTLSRESIRRVALRNAPQVRPASTQTSDSPSPSGSRNEQSQNKRSAVMNVLVWLPMLIGFFITPFIALYLLYAVASTTSKTISEHDYFYSVVLVSFSVCIELLSEPIFILTQQQLKYKERAIIEAVSILSKSLGTVLIYLLTDYHLLSFASGYLAYSMVLTGFYYALSSKLLSGNKLDPPSSKDLYMLFRSMVYPETAQNASKKTDEFPDHQEQTKQIVSDTISFSKQTALKLLLTEGEKLVLVNISSVDSYDLGIYAMVFNLGSLVARFVFAPVEEISYSLFARATREKEMQRKQEKLDLLAQVARLMTVIGLIFASFGSTYSETLILLLYGRAFPSAQDLSACLSLYCFYVLVIGVNGVLEAFVMATSEDKHLETFNYFLLLCSASHIVVTYLLVQVFEFGAKGLVLANSVNMMLRITYHLRYIKYYHTGDVQPRTGVKGLFMVPKWTTCAAFGASFLLTNVSARMVYSSEVLGLVVLHVLIGGVSLAGCLGVIYFTDRQVVNDVKQLYALKTTTEGGTPSARKKKKES